MGRDAGTISTGNYLFKTLEEYYNLFRSAGTFKFDEKSRDTQDKAHEIKSRFDVLGHDIREIFEEAITFNGGIPNKDHGPLQYALWDGHFDAKDRLTELHDEKKRKMKGKSKRRLLSTPQRISETL